jgi:hypothetical protein
MESPYVLRMANVADAGEIARHRGLMFLDMGLVDVADADKLLTASAPWFIDVMERGLYKGWVIDVRHMGAAAYSERAGRGPISER